MGVESKADPVAPRGVRGHCFKRKKVKNAFPELPGLLAPDSIKPEIHTAKERDVVVVVFRKVTRSSRVRVQRITCAMYNARKQARVHTTLYQSTKQSNASLDCDSMYTSRLGGVGPLEIVMTCKMEGKEALRPAELQNLPMERSLITLYRGNGRGTKDRPEILSKTDRWTESL